MLGEKLHNVHLAKRWCKVSFNANVIRVIGGILYPYKAKTLFFKEH